MAAAFVVGQATPAFVLDIYRTAKDAGTLWLLLLALCIAGPVTEEFAVRGFLFRGWSQSCLGPVGANVLSSALWAAVRLVPYIANLPSRADLRPSAMS